MTLPVHPATRLFPAMPEEELDRLAEDIRLHGLLHPIVLHEGGVLDGRNRLEACRRAGVEPRFVTWEASGSPLQWVIAQNVLRRHLSSSQRAVLALTLLPMLEEEARARRRAGAARSRSAQKCALLNKPPKRPKIRAAGEAARLVGASPRYVQAARRVDRQCCELLPFILAGRMSLSDAQRAAKLGRFELRRILEKIAQAPPNEDINLRRLVWEERQHLPARRFRRAPPGAHQFQITLTPEQLRSLDEGANIPITLADRPCLLRRQVSPSTRKPPSRVHSPGGGY